MVVAVMDSAADDVDVDERRVESAGRGRGQDEEVIDGERGVGCSWVERRGG